MTNNLFRQNIIVVIWDFDKTLIPSYMQEPLFDHYGVDSKTFWDEVNELPAKYKEDGLVHVSVDLVYLNHLLSYVKEGKFKGLSNKKLMELGAKINFYEGMPEFLEKVKENIHKNTAYAKHDIKVEHYVVSTGLSQMILGSKISRHVDGVWGCDFVEAPNDQQQREIHQVGYAIDNTTKTRAIFEINKGSNEEEQINVNAFVKHEDRRVPFQNMIYIADGPSDIPVFSVINQYGGKTFAVYKNGNHEEFKQANELQKQNRVNSFGPALYTQDSQTSMWIMNAVEEIANRVVQDRERSLNEKIGPLPQHLTKE